MARALPVLADCVPSCACTGTNIDDLIEDVIAGRIPAGLAYDTVADLRANTVYTNKGIYETSGELVADDGNGHIYIFRVASVAVDNGLSVVKPDDIDAADPGRYLQYI